MNGPDNASVFDIISEYLKGHPRLCGAVMAAVGASILLYAMFTKQLSGTFRMDLSIDAFGELGTRIVLGLMGIMVLTISIIWLVRKWDPYNR